MTTDERPAAGTPGAKGPAGAKKGTAALVLLVLAAVFAYYRWLWGSLAAFGTSVDHYDLFCDFVRHYHPMGHRILAFPYPIEGFYYSAFFALALWPIGLLKLPAATWAWGILQVLLAAALGILSIGPWSRRGSWRTALAVLLFVTSMPVLHNYKWGQVSVLVTLGVLASLWAYASGRDAAAGALLAACASVNYYAAWFVVFYVLRRRWKAVGAFAATGVVCLAVVPAIVLGPATVWQFHREAFENVRAIASLVAQDWNSQFFPHVLLRWLGTVDAPGTVRALAMAGWLVGAAAAAVVWLLRRQESRDASALSMAALFLALPFLVTTSWPHYLVYLPFCQLAVISGLLTRPSGPLKAGLLAASAVSIAFASVFAFNAVHEWSVYARSGALFVADVLLMPGVAVLAIAAAKDATSPTRS